MSEFEDNLWREVVDEYGPALARAERPATARGLRARPRLLAGTTAGAVAVGTGVALLLSATASSPAFAVTRHRDGSVTLRLMRVSGIAGANQQLAAMGVRAKIVDLVADARAVAVGRSCAAPVVVPAVTLVPSRIPRRRMLVLGADRRARLIYYASPAASHVHASPAPGHVPALPRAAIAPIPVGSRQLDRRLIKRARALAGSSTGAAGPASAVQPAPARSVPAVRLAPAARPAPVIIPNGRIVVPAPPALGPAARAVVRVAPVLVPTARVRTVRFYCGSPVALPPVATPAPSAGAK